jgi:hypothetical protein
LISLLKYIRWLSLDIAFGGAILLSFVVQKVYDLELPFPVIVAFSIAVLIIYTADHILDARRLQFPTMSRHIFHKNNSKWLTYYLIFLTVGGFICLFFLPKRVILAGITIALFSIFYLIVNRLLSKMGIKEFTVAFVYSLAIFILPIIYLTLSLYDGLMFLQLLVLAFSNLLIISIYEHEYDQKDRTTSFVHVIGFFRTKYLVYFLLLIDFTVALIIYFFHISSDYQLFIALSTLCLFAIVSNHRIFSQNERYRWASDLIFALPILF